MFMEDISIFFTTVDVVIFITDFIPKIIEKGIEAWDIWIIYIIGSFINYADWYYVTEIGIDPGEDYNIAMASISLISVTFEITVIRPIVKILKIWDFVATQIGNLSLIIGLGTQFEEDVFKALGIRDALQEYLKNYNDCYSNQKRMLLKE
jgi:hypothetical protein